MNEESFNKLNEGDMDFSELEHLQEVFANAVPEENRFVITPRQFTALRLGIRPSKFASWRKKVNKRHAKNKVARASRKANRCR